MSLGDVARHIRGGVKNDLQNLAVGRLDGVHQNDCGDWLVLRDEPATALEHGIFLTSAGHQAQLLVLSDCSRQSVDIPLSVIAVPGKRTFSITPLAS